MSKVELGQWNYDGVGANLLKSGNMAEILKSLAPEALSAAGFSGEAGEPEVFQGNDRIIVSIPVKVGL